MLNYMNDSFHKAVPIYNIAILHVTDFHNVDMSGLVFLYEQGRKVTVPVYSFLITGPNIPPILVDTGANARDFEDLKKRYGFTLTQTPQQTYEAQLQRLGYRPEDIRVILHTHLHFDHCGSDDLFPDAKIIFERKEMMFSVSDIMTSYYDKYLSYLVHQVNTPGRVRLFDSYAEIVPGICLETLGGHTMGSTIVKVNTAKGLAIITGDIIFNTALQTRYNPAFPQVEAQTRNPIESFGDWPVGFYYNLWEERAAVQRIMREADIVLPSHDPDIIRKYGYVI